MNPNELRQKAAGLEDKAHALVNLATAENRDMTPDEKTLYDGFLSEADSLLNRAKTLEAIETRIAARSGSGSGTGRVSAPIGTDGATADRNTERGMLQIGNLLVPTIGEGDKRSGFGDFMACLAIVADSQAHRNQREWADDQLENLYRSKFNSWVDDKRPKSTRSMAQTSGLGGGYTVPSQFYKMIMKFAAPMSIVRQRAMVIPMDTDEIDVPFLDQTTPQAAGVPPWFGGIVATWSAEAAQINSTDAGIRQAKLQAHELTGYTEISRTLLANSAFSLDAMLYQWYGGAVAWYEDYAFLRGDGKGKPLGVQNANCRIQTADRGSATAITFANAINVWVRVPEQCRSTGVWLGSQGAEAAILQMAGISNSVFVPAGYYIAPSGETTMSAAGMAVNYAILNRPVIITAKLPTLDTDMDFGYYDFMQYMVGDRGVMEVAASEHFKFRNNQMAYRFVHKVGGLPWLNAAVTIEDGSTTQSPFVSLGIH